MLLGRLEGILSGSAPPFLVLGKFTPSRLHENTIAAELQEWLTQFGIIRAVNMHGCRMPIGVRNPADNLRIASSDNVVRNWHRDGFGKYPGADYTEMPASKWFIFWSNGSSTELCDKDMNVYIFERGDVLLVDNENIQHRCPPPEENRWFARLADPILPTMD